MTFANYPCLAGRVVFVTGGASGIGASFVEQFHAQGAKVAFVDRQIDAGEALAAGLPGSWFRPCNVTDGEALTAAILAAADFLTTTSWRITQHLQ